MAAWAGAHLPDLARLHEVRAADLPEALLDLVELQHGGDAPVDGRGEALHGRREGARVRDEAPAQVRDLGAKNLRKL